MEVVPSRACAEGRPELLIIRLSPLGCGASQRTQGGLGRLGVVAGTRANKCSSASSAFCTCPFSALDFLRQQKVSPAAWDRVEIQWPWFPP